MRLTPSELLSRLNSSYWFVPLVVTLAGFALAVSLLVLDSRLSLDPEGPLAILRPGSAAGARAFLSAVISAMITVISVTFSVTIVALTVAAQHFGPRVLNNFVRQTSAQIVLGTFMGTFAYSVLALVAIRGSGPDAEVPEATVSGAVVLVVVSIGALIYYVHHVSMTLQIGEIAASIAVDLRQAVSRGENCGNGAHELSGRPETIPDPPPDATEVIGGESGYVQRIDYEKIVQEASSRGATVWIRCEPGTFMVARSALALVHPPTSCDEGLAQALRGACVLGQDRTLWHDPEFAVKQLVEIALRALSPGVNEPFTAITCIDRLTEGLASAATVPPANRRWCDPGGHPRVYVRTQSFATLLRAAFDPIRIFAGRNPAIYTRLLESAGELALIASDPDDRRLLREQMESIRRAAMLAVEYADDRAHVEGRYERAVRQVEGRRASLRR